MLRGFIVSLCKIMIKPQMNGVIENVESTSRLKN